MNDAKKYETELQRLLADCGENWETLARALFETHQGTLAEREADHGRMMRAFVDCPKSALIRGKTISEIWVMKEKFDEHKKPRDTTKATLARMKTTLPKQRDRDEWEKVLAEYNSKTRKALENCRSNPSENNLGEGEEV